MKRSRVKNGRVRNLVRGGEGVGEQGVGEETPVAGEGKHDIAAGAQQGRGGRKGEK